MDTKALRQKILDLAIHGKLVPQDPNDEPASVLLERIRTEKERLIKEGKIKKGKKSAKTSDKPHYPYELPKGWEWTTVGEISQSILYGVSESAKSHGAYKLLRITDIQNNFVNWETVPFTDYDESKAESYLLKDGDILFARTGATVGKSYLVNSLQENAIYASYLIRVQTYNQVLPEFVKYFFESGYYWSQILCNSVGIGQPNVNGTILANLMLLIPPITEQKRIVKELTKWLSIIDKIDRGKENLQDAIKHAKSKILDLAIHGKLVPQDPNDEPATDLLKRINPKAEIISDNGHYQNLPKGWCLTTLESITNYGSCVNVSVQEIPKDAWVLELEDIEKDSAKILCARHKKDREIKGVRHRFKAGDILYSKLRTYLNKVLIAPNEGFCTTEIIPISVKLGIHNKYICHVLRSQAFLDYTAQCGYGVKMPRLSTKDAQNGIIPLPPYNEQLRIVSMVEKLLADLGTIEESLAR